MSNPNVKYKPTPEQEAINYMRDFGYDHMMQNTSPECRAILVPLFRDVARALVEKLEGGYDAKK